MDFYFQNVSKIDALQQADMYEGPNEVLMDEVINN